LVAPSLASRSVRYVCPGCSDRLTYRAGPIVSAHFAHRGGTGCTPESVLHSGTKLRIAAAIQAWLAGTGPRPVVRRRCQCGAIQNDPIRDGIVRVSVEHRLRARDREVIADLALLTEQGTARLLIEVLVSHAVDGEKESALRAARLPWIEVEAEEVEPDASVWKPRASGNVRPLDCQGCAAKRQERERVIAAVAASQGSQPVVPKYLTSTFTCYRCQRPTLLYLWRGMFHDVLPPRPRPATLSLRYSGVVLGKYWANTCGHCHAMIGNWYVKQSLSLEEFYFTAGGDGSH
jgi:hypothetical protein